MLVERLVSELLVPNLMERYLVQAVIDQGIGFKVLKYRKNQEAEL